MSSRSSSRPVLRLLVVLAQLAGGSHAALSASPAPTAASILQNCERALPPALPEDAAPSARPAAAQGADLNPWI